MDQAVLSAHEVRVADLLLETLQRKLNEPVDGVAQHGLKNCQQKWFKEAFAFSVAIALKN